MLPVPKVNITTAVFYGRLFKSTMKFDVVANPWYNLVYIFGRGEHQLGPRYEGQLMSDGGA